MKNTQVVCINDKFSPEVKAKIKNLPVEGHIYTIRKVVRNADGSYGLLLNEIRNTKRPVQTQWEGMSVIMEPNFHPSRFTTFSGGSLTTTILDRIIRTQTEKEKKYETA